MKIMVIDGNSIINRAFLWRTHAEQPRRFADQCDLWFLVYAVSLAGQSRHQTVSLFVLNSKKAKTSS